MPNGVKHEDIEVLPLLRLLTKGRKGTYLEIGAAWGWTGSQTLLLEKCFNWTGILVEAHPLAFAKTQETKRHARMVHAAACPEGTEVHVPAHPSRTGINAVLELTTDSYLKNQRSTLNVRQNDTIAVPCREVRNIVKEAGLEGLDYISVDVQGAELEVLQTCDLSTLKVVMVEAEARSTGVDKVKKVSQMLRGAGLKQLPLTLHRKYDYAYNELWVQPGVVDARPWHADRDTAAATHELFAELQQKLAGPDPRMNKIVQGFAAVHHLYA